MADRIVEEANHAFHLNMNMFKELEGNLVAAIVVCLFPSADSGPATRKLLHMIKSIQESNVVYNDSDLGA